MPDVLDRILATKVDEVAQARADTPLATLEAAARAADRPRGFAAALRRRIEAGAAAVIAEVKKASPSKGLLRPDFDPAAIARSYEAGGATCLSVLTDAPYFQGSADALSPHASACGLPVLRKDFIVDAYQLSESRAMGADCILLIVAALDDARLASLRGRCRRARHGRADRGARRGRARPRAARRPPIPRASLIGINNRDLRTFETRLETTLELLVADAGRSTARHRVGHRDAGRRRRGCAARASMAS